MKRPVLVAAITLTCALLGMVLSRAAGTQYEAPDSTPLGRSTGLYLFLLVALYSLPLWIHDVWAETGAPNLAAAAERPEAEVHWPRVAVQAALCGVMMAAVLTLRSTSSLNFIYFAF